MKNTLFKKSGRIERLHKRNLELAQHHKRDIYVDNPEFLVYHWSGKAATFSPATGDTAASESERINLGDHNCRIDVGGPFPFAKEMPSKVSGFSNTPINFATDYAFFLDHSPVAIHPYEKIVGEFYWQLDEARYFKYPQENQDLGFKAREMGAGGMSLTHTCPDLSIGLDLGWNGILKKIRHYKEQYQSFDNQYSYEYLCAAEIVCESIIRYVERYAEEAKIRAKNESDPEIKAIYESVSRSCRNLVSNAPSTFLEALQWINFFQIAERIIGHGNGYGRMDQLLLRFYRGRCRKKAF
ncbi:MAG: pyruvate formate lyase family protein [Parabacteroides sp.]